ncbi:MAG: hypothetical protein NTW10_06700 [Bacteroidetes bacterium]|nr:hypothetical protein [Bacteroidota bacterium]
MEEIKTTSSNPTKDALKRPFLLTLLCLFSFVFSGLITLLFLLALLWSGTIADMVLRYAPENSASGITVFFYTLAGFLLHALSLTGIILIWRMKRIGYLLFGISFLIIAGYQLIASQISPLTTGFYIGLIIAFGLFLRKLK